MFNKKLNLLLITLVFMLSISAVAAFDSAAVDDIESSDADEEPPSGSTLNESDIKSVSQDSYCLETMDVSMYYKNGTRYVVTLTQGDKAIENASVIINICGVNYTRVTDSEGKASLAINLNPGNYTVSTFYRYDVDTLNLGSDIEVLPTISGKDVVKTYRNATQYYATFLDDNGNPFANANVTFNINGVFYNRKTDSKGIAKLNINLNSGKYILTAIHQNGLMYSNTITVLPSINATDLTKFYKNGTQYYAKFYNSKGNALVKANVSFNINGVFYPRVTDSNGMAKLNINLLPGTYILTAINSVNGEMASSRVTVLPTMITSDVVSKNRNTTFSVILLNGDGSGAGNKKMEITVDGVKYSVKTDKSGNATLKLNLIGGIHKVVSKDPVTGLEVSNYINITAVEYYSKYGVSPDNKTLMAIGRPSASGEVSQYGYKFYVTTFERICPYCGSTELYWGIFWAGNESTNYGLFPATGNKEGGSIEGHIFCAKCDADWSIFGNEHKYGGKSLKTITKSVSSSKADAYLLKNGKMVYA